MNSIMHEQTRDQIKKFLPEALQKALHSYHTFIERDEFAANADFSKDHTACKVAISHIELLIKLGRLAYGDEQEDTNPEILRAAQKDLQNYYNSNGDLA